MTWTVRSASPLRVGVIFAVAFLALVIGWFGFGRSLFGLLGFAMILGSTADAWLGTRFTLDAMGASARTGPSVTAMAWSDVQRILVNGREVRLSPLEGPSTLDAFRGVGLVTIPENHEAVLEFVRSHAPLP